MRWAEITIETTQQGQDAVSNIILENGASGTAIQGETPIIIKGYLPVDDRLEDRLLHIRNRVKSLPKAGLDTGDGDITITYIEDEAWAESWKQFFHTTRVGNRIIIKPTWDETPTVTPKAVVIDLDPGMAFGTGTHPTTRMCLQALERYIKPGNTVVDFGTGSGILSIAAAKMRAALVIAFDTDETAVRAARENILRNDTDNVTEVHQADSPTFINVEADVVAANIVAEVIIKHAPDIAHVLRTGGVLIASGITTEKTPEMEQILRNSGFDIADKLIEGEWAAIIARKAG